MMQKKIIKYEEIQLTETELLALLGYNPDCFKLHLVEMDFYKNQTIVRIQPRDD